MSLVFCATGSLASSNLQGRMSETPQHQYSNQPSPAMTAASQVISHRFILKQFHLSPITSTGLFSFWVFLKAIFFLFFFFFLGCSFFSVVIFVFEFKKQNNFSLSCARRTEGGKSLYLINQNHSEVQRLQRKTRLTLFSTLNTNWSFNLLGVCFGTEKQIGRRFSINLFYDKEVCVLLIRERAAGTVKTFKQQTRAV